MKTKSIKTAIIVPMIVALTLGVAIMVTTVAILSSNTAADMTDRLIHADIVAAQSEFSKLIESIGGAVDALPSIFLDMVDSDFSQEHPREYALSVLTNLLLANSDIIAAWTCWEPNAFDGADSLFINAPYHDSTGRFIPQVSLNRAFNVTKKALTDYNDPIKGEYYTEAKASGKPHMTEPFYRDLEGQKELLLTYSVPVIKSGRVVGVIGADFLLDNITSVMNSFSVLDDGYLYLLSTGGYFTTHPNTNLIMNHYSTTWLGQFSREIETLINTGGSITATGYSDALNAMTSVTIVSMVVGGNQYLFCAVVPLSTVNASSMFLMWLVIIIGLAMLLIISLITYSIVSRSLTDLPNITHAA
ncbi:MAG: hypothetical protein FWE82_09550, partial [Defluviitaleaceae bacterium]|nr:hypothetical protein [Defluviitaleaceae bacterium]